MADERRVRAPLSARALWRSASISAAMLLLGLPCAAGSAAVPSNSVAPSRLPLGAESWPQIGHSLIRGITVGPIESALHPGRGYGSDAFARTVDEAHALGANWLSLTPFSRVWDLQSTGISLSFEAPFTENRAAVMHAVAQAHAAGQRVLLVPHLWVESGGWRGELDPGSDAAWAAWAKNYRAMLLTWAQIARDAHVDMLAVGVELRSWLTTAHAASFAPILHDVRSVYPGLLTYAGNWDDIEQTVILGDLDVIGLNAFFPLAEHDGASFEELQAGGRKVRERVEILAETWQKPVFFNEFGYTTRTDPAVRPWEWPDKMSHVHADQAAQAEAYRALLGAFTDAPWFAGFFTWRFYADPDDMSQEAEWGFSPRGKLAELALRDAFAAHWAGDGPEPLGGALFRDAASDVGKF